jgi:hypothetical protein
MADYRPWAEAGPQCKRARSLPLLLASLIAFSAWHCCMEHALTAGDCCTPAQLIIPDIPIVGPSQQRLSLQARKLDHGFVALLESESDRLREFNLKESN